MLALLFVVSVLLVPHAGLASPTTRSNQLSGLGALRSAPLTQVSGAAPMSSGTSTLGQYTVLPESAQFSASALLTVTVGFKTTSGLQQFVSSLNDPNSQSYRHFVTTGQLGAAFGISPTTYSTISSYFESYGMTVTPSNSYMSMQVTGTVSQMEQAFHTTLGAYALQYQSKGIWQPLFGNDSGLSGSVTTSPVFYVNTQGINLPSSVASQVSGVVGLSGAMATPNIALPQGFYPGVNLTALFGANSTTVSPAATYFSTSQIQGINGGNYTWGNAMFSFFGLPPQYQFLYPSTMHMLTGANNLWNGQNTIASEPDQGQGVTVAVIEVGSIPLSWLQSFSQQVWGNPNQITNRLSVISPGFGQTQSQMIMSGFMWGWSLETALDIEYIAAMAPLAHIDIIGVPAPFFSAFDQAYAYTAQFLTSGASAAASVTITSNSYGSGEAYVGLFGSPMYLTVENTLLEVMNAVGITNFFASGDYAASASGTANTAGMPAISPGSTSVGGGMTTAYGTNGQEFPVTGNTLFTFSTFPYFPLYVVPAQGLASYTYWAYGFGLSGTFQGIVGGGYGQSITETQPWWQNALDTYSTGAAIDPVISGPAAFNMTVYAYGSWQYFYGGTSFATPISAGEWALIEEQANMAFGTPAMGNINPILFAAHNGNEAGVSSLHVSPYATMQDMGVGFDWAPYNNFNWYYSNLSINTPSDPVLPWWFNTLYNPAGSGWNYLQGLGMISVTTMDNELVGQTPSTQHALMNEPFSVLQVTNSGLQPITSLQSGTTYTFRVVLANGQPGGYYNVVAYSNNSNDGTYGGGIATTLQTGSNGQFTYTPQYSSSTPAGSDYGYFLLTSVSGSDWSFQPFAVVQPMLTSGTLTVGVTNAYGQFETGAAEVTMFTTQLPGFYNLWGIGPAAVTLNGQPVANAVISEVSVNVSQFQLVDPTMPLSSYAPGTTLGTFLSDQRGTAAFWTDAFLAENNGPLYTQVVTLQASYRGLTSNVVTVYIEPQAGTFNPAVSLNSAGTALVGNVTFNGMLYTNYVNISIGSAPGQFVNVSYPGVYYDSIGGITISGVANGVIPIDFTNLPPAGQPIQLSMVAEGANDLSFSFTFFFFSFVFPSVQNPMYWSDPVTISNPGPAPAASLASSAYPTVNGDVTLSYAGSWATSGATGTLTLSYGNTASTLLSTGVLTGSYVWNSANYADGFYTLTYTVSTPTGLHSSSSVVLYVDNTASQLNAQIVTLQGELKSADNTISMLKGELSSANATIAAMQTQINSLNSQVSTLTSQLSTLNAQYNASRAQLSTVWAEYNTTQTELATAQAQLAADSSTMSADNATILNLEATINTDQATMATQTAAIGSLQTQLSSDNTTISFETAQVASLKSQIASLQSELNAKKGFVAPAWYDIFGGAGAILIGIIAVVGGLAGAVIGRHRKTKKAEAPSPANLFMVAAVPEVRVQTHSVHKNYRRLKQ